MKTNRYLYVEARGWFHTEADIDGRNAVMTDDPISFDSVLVEAADLDEAELLGAAAMDTRHTESKDATVLSHLTGTFLNYYVVQV